MFQFYFKEKFDVLRMFRLLVSSRCRRVRKSRGIGGVRCWTFLIVPTVLGKCRGYNIRTLTLLGFSVVKGGAKSRVVTISLSPQGGAYTRALESENHYPRPTP